MGMSDSNAAPSGADGTGASSSATATTAAAPSGAPSSSKPASAGRPSAGELTKSLRAKRAEKVTEEQASSPGAKDVDAALGSADAEGKPEDETASPQAGKGDDKPKEKEKGKDGELPGWVKERLGKEKARREKLEADAGTARTERDKFRTLFEAAVQENERLVEQLRAGAKYDERDEELQALRIQQSVKEQLAAVEAKAKEAFDKSRHDERIEGLAQQIAAEVADACKVYPLVDEAEVRARLRASPRTDIREFARARHEERMAFARGGARTQQAAAPTNATTAALATVAKPTGTSKALPPLTAKGMGQAMSAARAKR